MPADARLEGREERRTVTILFCDLVDSTARFDLADPEEVRATLATYHQRVEREIRRFGGTVEKFIGDAVMAVYGVPVVHEDDAQRAVYTALRILPAIEELNEGNRDLPLAVRIGIETGEAVVDLGAEPSRHGVVFGDVVNTASRLQGVAPSGGILVGEGTYLLTSPVFVFEPIDPVRVRGKGEPLRVWRATGARSRFGAELHPPSRTPYVDREDELELLKRTFARTKRERSVQLVTLMGEPGVGKTRLVREFFNYVDDLPETTYWRQGRCLPYGEGVTFWALGEVVKAHAGILDSDGAKQAGEKLAAAVSALVEDASEREWMRARLAPLIGLAGAQTEGIDRVEAFSAWRRFFEAMATIRPLVLVLEDMHWADTAMLAFAEHIVEWSAGVPILIVCTARPELFDRDPRWGGATRGWSTISSLQPLAMADAERLTAALLPPEAPASLHDLVVARAGGNPLFAEELVRMLGERWPTEGPPAEAIRALAMGRTPKSVQAIIAARLDTLAPMQKTLLLDAAVVGRTFWAGALASMAGSDRSSVDAELHELARRELIKPSRAATVEEEAEFSFWHSLIREVAYGQIPRSRRAQKHVAAAAWIERMAGERLFDHAELLAYHYGEALKLTSPTGPPDEVAELEATTRRYWTLAGDRAMSLDIARAAECFARALELAPMDLPERGVLLARRGAAAVQAGRFRDAQRDYEDAIEQFRMSGDRLGEGAALDRLATVQWDQGDTAGSRVRLAEALAVLEGQPHGPELAECYVSLASDRMVTGHLEEAIAWAERSLELSSRVGAEHLRPRALSWRGAARCYAGDLGGLDDLDEGLRAAEQMGLARDQTHALLILAEVRWATDGPRRALEISETTNELATRRGLRDTAFACRTQALGPMFDVGRWDELLTMADEILAWSEAAGGGYDAITAQLWKAQVLLGRGVVEEATAIAADFMSLAREIADPQVLVPAVVVSGTIAVREGRLDDALRLVEDLVGASDVSFDWYREHFIADLARLCVSAGDLSLGDRLLKGAHAFALRHRLGMASARAAVEEAGGEVEAAAAGFAEASEGWDRCGHVVESALASLGAGRCLVRLSRAEAEVSLERARSIAAGLGAAPLLGEADDWLARAADLRGDW